jgi:hypothetical protein
MLQKVQGHNGLMRDKRTGAILNTNRAEIARAKALKAKNIKDKEQVETLSKEVSELKEDMADIKSLLTQLVEKN